MVTVEEVLRLVTEDDDLIVLTRYTTAYLLYVQNNHSTLTGTTKVAQLTFEEAEKISRALGGR